jgi:hypothetical protein
MSLSRELSRSLSRSLSRFLARSTAANEYLFYVDSVAGSDANSGLSASAPKQTLAAVQTLAASYGDGASIGLSKGSVWREQYTFPAANMVIGVYGTGAMPIIDGADVAGAWTQPNAGSYPNVWAQSWSRTSASTTGSEMLGYWENGTRPARYATNATTDLQTNGGWYSTDLVGQTSTVSIYATGNPNSDGVLREITRRHYGFSSNVASMALDRAGEILTGPIEIKRCVGHYNALALGSANIPRQFFLRDGNIHHMVTEGVLSEDILATEYSPQIAPSVFVAYKGTGAGFAPVFNRLLALVPGGASRLTGSNSAFYSHASAANATASLTLSGCASRGLNFASASSQLLTVNGGYCEDPYQSAITALSTSNNISYLMVRETTTTANSGGSAAMLRTGSNAYSFNLSHVASYTTKGACVRNTTGGVQPVISHSAFVNTVNGDGLTNGNANSTYNIFYNNGRCMDLITSGLIADFNVYYFVGQAAPGLYWNGTYYNTQVALATYVSASGQDTNSVFLKAADQTSGNALAFWLGIKEGTAGPSAGDFRINPACRVYGMADGVARTGVFGDNTTSITQAGPQGYYNFNTRSVASGPPSRYPVLPATIADMRTYIEDPSSWDFYP